MADVAETVKEAQPAEKEVEKVEKKVIDLEDDDKSNDETPEVKENGDSEKNGDTKAETNGSNGVSPEANANKRKSGTDATDGTVEGTPEKKAKVTPAAAEVESEESNSTNGSTEVTA